MEYDTLVLRMICTRKQKKMTQDVVNIPCLCHNTELCSHVQIDLKEKSPGPIRKELEKEYHNPARRDEQLLFTAIPMHAIDVRLTVMYQGKKSKLY